MLASKDKKSNLMKMIIHKAAERGYAHHGWLETHHTFSFASWYDPRRMNFGALRVLNDDTVAGGEGFGAHPHENMEIVSIPLAGQLRHGDSMGNQSVLEAGQIQVMSAGTGVVHSEYNNQADRPVEFLQIWVFPDRRSHTPRYEDIAIGPNVPDKLHTIVTPEDAREKGAGWIHQRAWFHLIDLTAGAKFDYTIRQAGNGLYVFVIDGEAEIASQPLGRRDGVGISETEKVKMEAILPSKLLLIEVPI